MRSSEKGLCKALEGFMSSIKEKLKIGTLTLGSWITLASPAIAEIMAKAGFDWLTVDLEHSVITIHEAENLIRVIGLCGAIPLVRLSANDPEQIKKMEHYRTFFTIYKELPEWLWPIVKDADRQGNDCAPLLAKRLRELVYNKRFATES